MSTSSEKAGFVRLKEKVPYTGKGIEELLGFLRRTLTSPDNKFTQKITLEVGVPFIRFEKLIPEAQIPDVPQISLHDAVRSKPMEEYRPEDRETPMHQLWGMFDIVQAEGLEVSHILVGDKHVFQSWLKVRIPVTRLTIFGVPLRVVTELPGDIFLVCGASVKDGEPDDIQFSVKGTCP